jgi:ferredoxin-fold anticodon binding domain-containing protein
VKIKVLSNEEIRKKREKLNSKLMAIHKLIQEGKFSEAEKEAKEIMKTKKLINSINLGKQ